MPRMLAAADGEQGLESSEAAQCIERCYAMLASRFDSRLGGFGGAPKFPRPAEINLLLVEHLRSEDDRAASSAGSSTSGGTVCCKACCAASALALTCSKPT